MNRKRFESTNHDSPKSELFEKAHWFLALVFLVLSIKEFELSDHSAKVSMTSSPARHSKIGNTNNPKYILLPKRATPAAEEIWHRPPTCIDPDLEDTQDANMLL